MDGVNNGEGSQQLGPDVVEGGAEKCEDHRARRPFWMTDIRIGIWNSVSGVTGSSVDSLAHD
jgi:hypothetical protein